MTGHSPVPATDSRKQLRRYLRQRRRALSGRQQREASRRLARQLLRLFSQSRCRDIGLYLPNDGEIDPNGFIVEARRRGLRLYLPVLHPILGNQLWFYRFDPGMELTPNRFGIPEPTRRDGPRRPAWALDAVLMPLVGFDRFGGRLGMGGGFYDRTFAFKHSNTYRPPILIGMAHDIQEVERLPVQPWDVPLNHIVTPSREIVASQGASRILDSGRMPRWFGHNRIPETRFRRSIRRRSGEGY